MNGSYTCGNCASFQKCVKRDEPDDSDFPCEVVNFVIPVKVI